MHELPLLSAAACAIADTDDGRALQAISAMLSRTGSCAVSYRSLGSAGTAAAGTVSA